MGIRERLRRLYNVASEVNNQTIVEQALPIPGGTLVDLGCGDGSFTNAFAERARPARTVGIETEPTLAAQATARGIEVHASDLGEALPFADDSIDAVVSNQVIEHLDDTDVFLREIRRVLHPSGYAVLSTNNLASWHNVASLVAGWQPMPSHVSDEVIVGNPLNVDDQNDGSPYPMHRRIFTNRELSELAAHHGLEIEVDLTAGYYPLGERGSRIATRIDRRHGAFLVQRYRPAASPV